MRSYLNRTQIVKILYKTLNEIPVLSGIAQGRVLGQLIFILYLKEVIRAIKIVKYQCVPMIVYCTHWEMILMICNGNFRVI